MNIGWWLRSSLLTGVVSSLAACGGWVDIETQGAGGTSGSAGTSGDGAGASTAKDSRYSFTVVPGKPGADAAGEVDIVARKVSQNGQLIFGTTSPMAPPLPPEVEALDPGPQGFATRSDSPGYFVWSPSDGARAWESSMDPQCMSGDGSTIFTFSEGRADRTSNVVRWTKDTGFQELGTEDSSTNLVVQYCSYDGTRAAGYSDGASLKNGSWVWTQGQLNDRINILNDADGVADGSFGWVSPQGKVSFVSSYILDGASYANHVYWSPDAGPLQLVPQPSENCFAAPGSRDGNVIFSRCDESDGTHVYRWTAETKTFESIGMTELDVPVTPSADGSTLTAQTANLITWLRDGSTTVMAFPGYASVMGLEQDGSLLYIQQSGKTETAFRWALGHDPERLKSLPNLPCTELTYPDLDGADVVDGMAVGSASTPAESNANGCKWTPSRAVLWDSQGVRDITAELQAAGINLHGLKLHRADRLWADSSIRIQGIGQTPSGALRIWIAELPRRD